MIGYPSIDKPWLKYYPLGADETVVSDICQSCYSYIVHENRNRMNNRAIEYYGVKITYKEMIESIDSLAQALFDFGIRSDDTVTVCLPNVPEIIYCIYAINKLGAIANLIDPRTNAKGILERSNRTKSKLVITISNIIVPKINQIVDRLAAEQVIYVSPSDSVSIKHPQGLLINLVSKIKTPKCKSAKYVSYKNFVNKKGNNRIVENAFKGDRTAIIVYTSGTTGTTKGVMLSNENIIASKRLIDYGATNTENNSSFLGVIPFFSSYGALTGMNYSLASGWKIVMIPIFKPKDFGKLVIKYRIVSVLGVPRFWESFAYENKKTNLSYLKNPILGGDKISPISVDRVNEYLIKSGGNRLKIGYGASEFGGGIVITSDVGPYERNSVGEILPSVVGMVINPETGEELPYNEDGELCFYSPTMMLGYYDNEKETELITIYNRGIKFYRTGDRGHITKDGTVHIVDRYKRAMMRPDGHTVHASPIENAIMQHNSVQACCVVGIPLDEHAGVIPTAFIVLNQMELETEKVIIDAIDKLCLESLPERDKAHAYVIVDNLPYTLMGKIDYKVLENKRFDDLNYVVKDETFFRQ